MRWPRGQSRNQERGERDRACADDEPETADAAASLSAMPIYEYRCPNGHVFEVFQRMDAPSPEMCETCGASPVERVLYPVAVHFKGSGFYSTDYGRSRKRSRDSDSDSGDKAEKTEKPEKKPEKAAD